MNNSASYQYSEYTPIKQRDFNYVIRQHMAIVANIRKTKSWAKNLPLVYYDLYSGPGIDPEGDSGSPLIFLKAAKEWRLPYICHLYEFDYEHPEIFDSLARAVSQYPNATALNRSHESLIGTLKYHRNQEWVYGVAYADPSNAEIPVHTLRAISEAYPRLEIMVNLAAASYKRQVTREDYERIDEQLATIGKDKWIVRKPYGKHQWTILIGTYSDYPAWKKHGFFDFRSDVGRQWWNEVVYTKKERESKYQMRLFE